MPEVARSRPQQSTRVQFFNSPAEAIAACPTLDVTAPMPKDAFDDILGAYVFLPAERVRCQLVSKEGGGLCKEIHGRGWVIRRRDGVHGFIGRDCANKHFGADHAFTNAVRTAERQLKTDELVERLAKLLSDKELNELLQRGFQLQQRLRGRVKQIREQLPHSVTKAVYHMAKANRYDIVLLLERREVTENKDGEEVEKSKWEPTVIGRASSPSAIDITAIDELGERFRLATKTMQEAQLSPDQPTSLLRSWTRRLEDVRPAARDVDDAARALDAFLTFENLKLLCWLSHEHGDRLRVARCALSLNRGGEVSEDAARHPLDEWEKALRAQNGGRRFRVP